MTKLTQTYRRVTFGDAVDRQGGTTFSWYQVNGSGWRYARSEIEAAAKIIKIRFCYW